jgi:hypothetical protein
MLRDGVTGDWYAASDWHFTWLTRIGSGLSLGTKVLYIRRDFHQTLRQPQLLLRTLLREWPQHRLVSAELINV